MIDNINEFAKIENDSMGEVKNLYSELFENVFHIEALLENIDKLEKGSSDPDQLEELYRKEFMLYMRNVGIYEDLLKCIDRIEPTLENEFELAKIKRDADSLLKVEVIEL